MKKQLSFVLASLMVLVMACAMAGCGKPNLEDWYADNKETFTTMTDAVNAQADTNGCTVEVVVEDSNVLVFRYTLTEEFDTSDTEAMDYLTSLYDENFEAYSSTFTDMSNQITDETSTENVVLRLEAVNPDGTLLYSKDF